MNEVKSVRPSLTYSSHIQTKMFELSLGRHTHQRISSTSHLRCSRVYKKQMPLCSSGKIRVASKLWCEQYKAGLFLFVFCQYPKEDIHFFETVMSIMNLGHCCGS